MDSQAVRSRRRAVTPSDADASPKRGRPDKREDIQVVETIRGALVAGNTYVTACTLAGIGESTFHRWMSEGQEAPDDSMARDFFNMVRKAVADAEHRNVMVIQRAGTKNWQAAAWFLERRNPNHWARKGVMHITGGNVGGTGQQPVGRIEGLHDSALLAVLAAVIKRNPEIIPVDAEVVQ